MTNREALSKTNLYDLLMKIEKITGHCPIWTVSKISLKEKCERCRKYDYERCGNCVNDWLNEEVSGND